MIYSGHVVGSSIIKSQSQLLPQKQVVQGKNSSHCLFIQRKEKKKLLQSSPSPYTFLFSSVSILSIFTHHYNNLIASNNTRFTPAMVVSLVKVVPTGRVTETGEDVTVGNGFGHDVAGDAVEGEDGGDDPEVLLKDMEGLGV